jgi:hypothetical protein
MNSVVVGVGHGAMTVRKSLMQIVVFVLLAVPRAERSSGGDIETYAILADTFRGRRLPLPKRAAAIGLRPDMLAARPRAQHGDVAALAEVAARVATAGAINGRPQLRRCGSSAGVLRG